MDKYFEDTFSPPAFPELLRNALADEHSERVSECAEPGGHECLVRGGHMRLLVPVSLQMGGGDRSCVQVWQGARRRRARHVHEDSTFHWSSSS